MISSNNPDSRLRLTEPSKQGAKYHSTSNGLDLKLL